MDETFKNSIRLLSDYATPGVLLVIIAALVLLYWAYSKKKYREWERFIDSLPSWASTAGVLGTFIGITSGLLDFDTDPQLLDKSIQTLLDGLKTAFFTSLIGMAGSWMLSIIVDKLFDKYNAERPSSETEAIKEMTSALTQFSGVMQKQSESTIAAFESFKNAMTQIRTDVQSINTQISNQSKKQLDALDQLLISSVNVGTSINLLTSTTEDNLKDIKTATSTMTTAIAEINNHTGEILDTTGAMVPQISQLVETITNQDKIMRSYIDDILMGMTGTNNLLTRKFDEFTELMKKSNTEALKEAMESALAKLNEQMSDLIDRLITDNFTRLTECVDKLSEWQQENKMMIESLTRQYHDMEKDFEGTSTTLSGVKDSVHTLASDGSKLSQIVNALNRVMVEDERFVQMTRNLNDASENNKQTTIAFKEEVTALNEWVRKQRNFTDAVNALIATLNELSSIRDYSNEFWQDTKRGMNEGVSISSFAS